MKKVCFNSEMSLNFIIGPCLVAAEEKGDEDEDEDTPATRFVARLLKHLLKGFLAKDKNVRYRVVQVVAEMVSHLGEIECVYILIVCI